MEGLDGLPAPLDKGGAGADWVNGVQDLAAKPPPNGAPAWNDDPLPPEGEGARRSDDVRGTKLRCRSSLKLMQDADGAKKRNHLGRQSRDSRSRKLMHSGLMASKLLVAPEAPASPYVSLHLRGLSRKRLVRALSMPSWGRGGPKSILRKPNQARKGILGSSHTLRVINRGRVEPDKPRVRFAEQLVQDLRQRPRKRVGGWIPLLDDRQIALWHMLMVVPLAVESFSLPVRLALTEPGVNAQFFVDIATDFLFLIDLVVLLCQQHVTVSGDVTIRPHIWREGWWRFSRQIVPCLLLYLADILGTGVGWWWLLSSPRLGRLKRLSDYFARMSLDLEVSVRRLKIVQVTLMLFIAIHWVGCSFWFLARLKSFDASTWVSQLHLWNLIDGFQEATATSAEKYSLIAYKGINALTNIGYEGVVPDNWPEMLWAVIVMFLQVLVAAYILGTLFHYLVSKDEALEDYAAKLEMMQRFMEDRQLGPDLRQRMLAYFSFRFQKSKANYGSALELPRSLQLRVAETQYEKVIAMSQTGQGAALRGCNPQFMSMLLLGLNEVYLMPGEKFITKGDIARDLFFIVSGVVDVTTGEGITVKTVRGGTDETDGRSILGEVGFIFGIPHMQNAAARSTGDASMLVLSKDAYSELIATYPEQHDVISQNVLTEFGLDDRGGDLAGFSALPEEKEEVEKIRNALRYAVARRREELLASLQYTVVHGEASEVPPLLRLGGDVNDANYDGRTALHLAASAGRGRVVEVLLQEGADVNKVDRWGRTPLHQAVVGKRANVIEMLTQHGGVLHGAGAADLCSAATDGNIEHVARLLENGGNPDEGDYDQRTPLHLASASGQQKVVEYLLSKNANPNVKDRWGGTPIEDAMENGHVLVARLLRAAGAGLPSKGADQLCSAASRGDILTLQMLHDFGMDLDLGDYDRRTGFHLAASEGKLEVVAFMLSASADPNVEDRWGGRPLDDALRGGHLKCAKLIHANGGKSSMNTEKLDAIDMEDVRSSLGKIRMRKAAAAARKNAVGLGGLGGGSDLADELMTRRLGVVAALEEVARTRALARQAQDVLAHNALKPMASKLARSVNALHNQAMNTVGKQWPQGYQEAYRKMQARNPTDMPTSRWKWANARVIDVISTTDVVKRLTDITPQSVLGGGTEGLEAPDRPRIKRQESEVDLGLYEELEEARALSKSVQNEETDVVAYKRKARSISRDENKARGVAFNRIVVSQVEVLQTGFDVIRAVLEPHEDRYTLRVQDRDLPRALDALGIELSRGDLESILVEAWATPPLAPRRAIARSSDDSVSRPGRSSTRKLTRSVSLHGLWSSSPTFRRLLQAGLLDPGLDLSPGVTKEYEELVARAWGVLDPSQEQIDGSSSWTKEDQMALRRLAARAVSITDHLMAAFATSPSNPTVTVSTLHSVRPHVSETGMLLYDHIFPTSAVEEDMSPASFFSLIAKWLIADEGQGEEEDMGVVDHEADAKLLAESEGRCTGGLCGMRFPVSTPRLMAMLSDRRVAVRFEPAFRVATKGRPDGLRLHETEAFLEVVFPRYRFTKAQVSDIFSLLDKNGDGSVSFTELARVMRDHGGLSQPEKDARPWHVGIVILPHVRFWSFWDSLMRAFSLFNFVTVPVSISFANLHYSRGHKALEVVEYAIDVAFVLEILMRMIRSYVNENHVAVTDLKLIYQNYASQSLIPDLVAGFPFDLLALNASTQTKSFLRLPKLLRLRHVFRHWVAQRASVEQQTVSAGLKRLLVMAVSMVHIFACLFYYIGSRGPKQWVERMEGWFGGGKDADVQQSYLLSFYYVMATFTTNGLVGEMQPNNYEEVIFTFILQFVHITLYAYILGEISGLVMASDDQIAALRAQKATVDNFIRSRGGLTERLRRDIRAHFSESANDSASELNEVMKLMSHSLQVEVARHISRAVLDKVNLFSGASDGFLDQIAVMLREVVIPAGEAIYETNDPSLELYIVRRGVAERYVEIPGEEMKKEGVVRAGGVVGETEFFFGMRRVFTFRAGQDSAVDMFFLRNEAFKTLLRMFPQEERKIAANAIRGFGAVEATVKAASSDGGSRGGQSQVSGQEHFDSVVGGAVIGIVAELKSRRHAENVEQLMLAAAMGRMDQLRLDLESDSGLSVNTANGEGRTCLHVAASEGQIEVCKYLLSLGADPVLLDEYGNTCLGDALRHGHDEVAKVLHDAGGQLRMNPVEAACLLCEAASTNDIQTLNRYVVNGVDPSVSDYDKRSPLHLAASNGHIEAVKYLLDVGANMQQQDRWNGGALEDAVRHGHLDVQKLLRDRGARLSSSAMATKLCEAAAEGNLRMVETLLENGVDPCISDYDARTALHLAACNEKHAVVEIIIEHWMKEPAAARSQSPKLLLSAPEAVPAASAIGGSSGAGSDGLDVSDDGEAEVGGVGSSGGLDVSDDGEAAVGSEGAGGDDAAMVEIETGPPAGDVAAETMTPEEQARRRLSVLINPVDRMGGTPLTDAMREGSRVSQVLLEMNGGLEAEAEGMEGVKEANDSLQDNIRRADAKRRVNTIIVTSPERQVYKLAKEVCDTLENTLDAVTVKGESVAASIEAIMSANETGDGQDEAQLRAARAAAEEFSRLVDHLQGLRDHPLMSDKRAARDVKPMVLGLQEIEDPLETLFHARRCILLALEGLIEEAVRADS